MSLKSLAILEPDYRRFMATLDRLRQSSNSKLVFLLDRNGREIASQGELGRVDPTSLASLAAGNVAATDGLAKLIGEKEFSILFHEGEREHLHITVIGDSAILLVLFDERSSLGLVRLRVRRAVQDVEEVFGEITERSQDSPHPVDLEGSPFGQITDDDIEALFG